MGSFLIMYYNVRLPNSLKGFLFYSQVLCHKFLLLYYIQVYNQTCMSVHKLDMQLIFNVLQVIGYIYQAGATNGNIQWVSMHAFKSYVGL